MHDLSERILKALIAEPLNKNNRNNLNPASVSAKASHFETPSSDLVVAAGLRSAPCLFEQLLERFCGFHECYMLAH